MKNKFIALILILTLAVAVTSCASGRYGGKYKTGCPMAS
jgi:hypothetical protein